MLLKQLIWSLPPRVHTLILKLTNWRLVWIGEEGHCTNLVWSKKYPLEAI